MDSLGDWIAHDVITVAMVCDGDKTLEDLGIEELVPGTHIIKCRDVEHDPFGASLVEYRATLKEQTKRIAQLERTNEHLETHIRALWVRIKSEYPNGGFPDMGMFEDEFKWLGVI